jgi:hypothetical protein
MMNGFVSDTSEFDSVSKGLVSETSALDSVSKGLVSETSAFDGVMSGSVQRDECARQRDERICHALAVLVRLA